MKICSQCPRKCGSQHVYDSHTLNTRETRSIEVLSEEELSSKTRSIEDLSTEKLSPETISTETITKKFVSNEIAPPRLMFCGKPSDSSLVRVAKFMVHFWEEPCISGISGSGTVFLSGCNLGCAFCQNMEISNGDRQKGELLCFDELVTELLRLESHGCHNINFVTGTHYINQLIMAIRTARQKGLKIPIVWNSSSYEDFQQIQSLEPYVDVYLPDLKFFSPELSDKVAQAPDYFSIASKAIIEMAKQHPNNFYYNANINKCNSSGCHDIATNNTPIILKGLIIRHLILPGFYQDSIKILEWIEANLSNQVTLSLLSQYIPDFYFNGCNSRGLIPLDSLKRKLTTFEYDKVVNKALSLGFDNVFIQERESATKAYVPSF